MPFRVNFDGVDDSGDQNYPVIRAGVYRFQVVDGDEVSTKKGDPMWKLRLEVDLGEHLGHVVWDNLVGRGPGLSRVKMLYKQLGLPCEGDQELAVSDVVGLSVWAEIDIDEYEGKRRNVVTFAGYHQKHIPAGAAAATAKANAVRPSAPASARIEEQDDLPF